MIGGVGKVLEVSGVWVIYFGVLDESVEIDVGGYYFVEGFLVLEDVDFEVGFSDVRHVGGDVWGDQVKLGLDK